jgi:hypothetical protein
MLNHSLCSGFIDSGSDDWAAMEGERPSGANTSAPDARQEPDPGWQPL